MHKENEEMSSTITTGSLLQRIMKTTSLSQFFEQNKQHLKETDLASYLNALCREQGLSVSQVIGNAQIERSYGYQIFRGLRTPSRDKLLQLAMSMGLTIEQTQRLLRVGGQSALYPRLKRDAAILYCIRRGYSVLDTQDVLDQYGLSLLGDAGN